MYYRWLGCGFIKVIKVWAGVFVLVIPAVLALVQPDAVPLTAFYKTAFMIIMLSVMLMPVHEFGHFVVACYYAKRNKYDIKLEVHYRCIKCDNWAAYTKEELIFILQAGVQLVLLFDVYFAVLSALSGQGLVALEFFVHSIVSFEYNCTVDGVRDTDYYYIRYPDKLVSEEVNSSAVKKFFQTVYVILLFVILNILILNHVL